MTLSILIPTYDYVCYTLVNDLQKQCEALYQADGYEIIVMEDGGRDQVKAIANHKINELTNCRYIRNKNNIGRSAIRNYLADIAKGDWLLFVDSDAKVISDDFIKNYIETAKEGNSIICGGLTHTTECPNPMCTLRWRYERNYEVSQKKSDKPFRTFCFMIKKHIFQQVRFNESYNGYGLEDMQFGIDLQKNGYTITYIDNPLLNNDLESNSIFLKKTEDALHTLYKHQEDLGTSNLLTFIHLHPIIAHIAPVVYKMSHYFLVRNLLSTTPNITLFNFYKLGYFLSIRHE